MWDWLKQVVHKDFKNLDHYIAKHNAYSTWEAKRYLQLGSQNSQLSLNQRIKYGLLNTATSYGHFILSGPILITSSDKEGFFGSL
jgi:hypothetical protein